MTFDASEPGVVELGIESMSEWPLICRVFHDAEGDLAGDLGELMNSEDDMWEEIVVPELADFFSLQRQKIREIILTAQRKANDEAGSIIIAKVDAEDWYGVLNQAQLSLEKKYSFGPRQDADLAGMNKEAWNAFSRQRLYSSLQQLLLETLMD